jgi:hypothetical protein
MPTSRRASAILALVAASALLSSCATAAPGASPATSTRPPSSPAASPSSSPAAPTPAATPAPTDGPDAEQWPTADSIDCDAMLTPAVAAELRSRGLEPVAKAWSQFGFTPTAPAVECPWGGEGATASSAFYAWARLQPGQQQQFVSLVIANGYTVELSDRGTWIVTPPELAGGGALEALITADWVAFAGTRDDIDDIVWAR